MKKNQIKVEEMVYQILSSNPKTRDDDFELVAEFYYRLCPEILNMKFNYVFLGHKEFGLPSFESITRARRKIQSQNESLISRKAKEKRIFLEKEYRDYYSGKGDFSTNE